MPTQQPAHESSYQASGGVLLRRRPSGLAEVMQQIYQLLSIYNELWLVPGTVDRPLLAQEWGATPVLIISTRPSCGSGKADMGVGHSRRRHRGTQVHKGAQGSFVNTPLLSLPHNSQIQQRRWGLGLQNQAHHQGVGRVLCLTPLCPGTPAPKWGLRGPLGTPCLASLQVTVQLLAGPPWSRGRHALENRSALGSQVGILPP